MEKLVGVEARLIAVRLVRPLVERGQARFWTVHNQKIPITIHLENLHVVWLWDVQDLDGLKLGELVLFLVKLEDVGAAKELGDDDQHMVFDQKGFASNDGFSCEKEGCLWE